MGKFEWTKWPGAAVRKSKLGGMGTLNGLGGKRDFRTTLTRGTRVASISGGRRPASLIKVRGGGRMGRKIWGFYRLFRG